MAEAELPWTALLRALDKPIIWSRRLPYIYAVLLGKKGLNSPGSTEQQHIRRF